MIKSPLLLVDGGRGAERGRVAGAGVQHGIRQGISEGEFVRPLTYARDHLDGCADFEFLAIGVAGEQASGVSAPLYVNTGRPVGCPHWLGNLTSICVPIDVSKISRHLSGSGCVAEWPPWPNRGKESIDIGCANIGCFHERYVADVEIHLQTAPPNRSMRGEVIAQRYVPVAVAADEQRPHIEGSEILLTAEALHRPHCTLDVLWGRARDHVGRCRNSSSGSG